MELKAKIVAALKTKYSDLGFKPKVLEGLAASLEKSVTDESQIEAAVNGLEETLKVFQADYDRNRAEYNALKSQYDELKAKSEASSAKGGEQGNQSEPDDIQKKIDEAIAAKVAPLQEKLANYEAKEAKGARSAMISRIAKELGISEARAEEGFAISDEMDEEGIKTYLTKVRQNEVARGLPGIGKFPLAGDGEASKEEADAIVAGMKL